MTPWFDRPLRMVGRGVPFAPLIALALFAVAVLCELATGGFPWSCCRPNPKR